MYVRSDLAYNRKTELENNDIEDLWLELLLPKSKPIIIGTCYREPKNNKIINYLEATLPKLTTRLRDDYIRRFQYMPIK